MKSIFAGFGFIIVLYVLYCALGNGSLRGTFDQYFNQPSYPTAYDQQGPQGQVVPPQYDGYRAPQYAPQYANGCDTCDQPQAVPVPYQRAPFEYASSSYQPSLQRVYVQPVYRSVWRYNRYEQVLVVPGYYRQAVAGPRVKERRFSFDIGGFLSAFRR